MAASGNNRKCPDLADNSFDENQFFSTHSLLFYSRESSISNLTTVKMRSSRLARARADRRNTLDCALLNQMIIEPSIDEKTRSDKRLIQQQREYEREQKNALAGNVHGFRNSQRASANFDPSDPRSNDSIPVEPVNVPVDAFGQSPP